MGLLSLWPGMTAGSPLSPPLMTDSRVSMRYLLLGLSPLWHLTQDFSRIGFISFSKVTPVFLAAGGTLLISTFFSLSAARGPETISASAQSKPKPNRYDFFDIRFCNWFRKHSQRRSRRQRHSSETISRARFGCAPP